MTTSPTASTRPTAGSTSLPEPIAAALPRPPVPPSNQSSVSSVLPLPSVVTASGSGSGGAAQVAAKPSSIGGRAVRHGEPAATPSACSKVLGALAFMILFGGIGLGIGIGVDQLYSKITGEATNWLKNGIMGAAIGEGALLLVAGGSLIFSGGERPRPARAHDRALRVPSATMVI